ncbi:MAG: TRAP transporter small permease subunit, partial [Acidobacteria bacterium]|nr:TRAP transporter small permease subunit [Acidobacteriota bacterium]
MTARNSGWVTRALRALRRILDGLYLAGGLAGAAFLVAILVLVVAQMAARWSGLVFPGGPDYAGYAMAGASFLALAHALNRGAHIRVTLVLNALGRRRGLAEVWCYGVATVTAIFFARYAVKANIWSYRLNDVSQGQDATPLWIPQIAMSAGACLLALALADQFVRVLLTRHGGVE